MKKEIFAALITRVDENILDEARWLNSAGIGSFEDQVDNFEVEFQKMFGISYREAEELAERFFAKD